MTVTPDQIFEARSTAGHTQQQAAEAVGLTGPDAQRAWRRWETPDGALSRRAMPPGLFELYRLKTGQHPEFILTRRKKNV